MTTNPPPITEKVIEADGVATMPWVLFFNQMFNGDLGTEWTPEFTNLIQSGGDATFSGRYYLLTRGLVFFRATVTPASAGSTSSVAGSTAITNFPLSFGNVGVCFSVTSISSVGGGVIAANDNRVYVSTWTTIGVPVTVIGIAEVL